MKIPEAAPKKRVAKSARLRSFEAMILHKFVRSRTAGHHTRILNRVEEDFLGLSKVVAGAFVAVVLSAGFLAVTAVIAEEQEPQRFLFIAENEHGKLWANLTLTVQRTAEPYLPMVVAVENHSKKSITLDRESFWLSDLDDIVYIVPSVKEVRKNYDKTVMDYRTISYAGIPWENWRWTRRLERSNFFPDLRASSGGNTVLDRVTLRHRHAMVSLFYFERPRNLEGGRPFFLTVQPEGWEIPIRMRIVIS
jgi:hypothetical protein